MLAPQDSSAEIFIHGGPAASAMPRTYRVSVHGRYACPAVETIDRSSGRAHVAGDNRRPRFDP